MLDFMDRGVEDDTEEKDDEEEEDDEEEGDETGRKPVGLGVGYIRDDARCDATGRVIPFTELTPAPAPAPAPGTGATVAPVAMAAELFVAWLVIAARMVLRAEGFAATSWSSSTGLWSSRAGFDRASASSAELW